MARANLAHFPLSVLSNFLEFSLILQDLSQINYLQTLLDEMYFISGTS